jgi:hypothetical protein
VDACHLPPLPHPAAADAGPAEKFGQSLDQLWGDGAEDWETEDPPGETYQVGKRW